MNVKKQTIGLIIELRPPVPGTVHASSDPVKDWTTERPQRESIPPVRQFRLSVRPATSPISQSDSAHVPTFIAELTPEPPTFHRDPRPARPPHRSRSPQAAILPLPKAHALGVTQPMTMFILLAAAIFVFVIAAGVLFHDPLTHVLKTRELTEQRKLLADRQEAGLLALKEALLERLDGAEDALAELQSANDQLTRQVEVILRFSLEAAIDHPPTHLRHAILTSDACLYAWTTVLNSHLTSQQFDAQRQRLRSIRTDLDEGPATQAHQRDLNGALQWIRHRRDAIAMIDLGPLCQDNAIDTPGVVRTITLQERR